MRAVTVLFMIWALSATVAADTTAEIEFQQRMQALGKSISTENSQESEYCRELARRIQNTFGPQRNFVAKEEYRRECMRQDEPAPVPPPAFDR